jgi:hypothetical protein
LSNPEQTPTTYECTIHEWFFSHYYFKRIAQEARLQALEMEIANATREMTESRDVGFFQVARNHLMELLSHRPKLTFIAVAFPVHEHHHCHHHHHHHHHHHPTPFGGSSEMSTTPTPTPVTYVPGPIDITIGETVAVTVLGFDQFGNAMPASFEMPTPTYAVSNTALTSVTPNADITANLEGIATGGDVLTATVVTAEGLTLTATAVVNVAAVAPPPNTPVLTTIQLVYAPATPATPATPTTSTDVPSTPAVGGDPSAQAPLGV